MISVSLECCLFFFFSFWPQHMACGILVPWPGIEPEFSALETQNLNQRTSREVPSLEILSLRIPLVVLTLPDNWGWHGLWWLQNFYKVFTQVNTICPEKWVPWSLEIVECLPQVENTFSQVFFFFSIVKASDLWQGNTSVNPENTHTISRT